MAHHQCLVATTSADWFRVLRRSGSFRLPAGRYRCASGTNLDYGNLQLAQWNARSVAFALRVELEPWCSAAMIWR